MKDTFEKSIRRSIELGQKESLQKTENGIGADKAFQAEIKRLRRLLYNAPIAMFIIDLLGRFEYANAKLFEITGYSALEWEGKNFAPIVHPKDLPLVTERINLAIRGEINTAPYEIRIYNKSGQIRTLMIYPEVVYNRNNRGEKEITGFQVFAEDVTERKKMEEEMLKAKKLETVGILAGGIAHDFNNILAGIMVNISYAKSLAQPEDKIFRLLSEAEESSSRARDLTDQLLTFSKGGSPVKKITSINELLKQTGGFSLRGSQINLSLSIPDGLWSADVDRNQISQVIHNLIINAKQAMPRGGSIEVRAENIFELDEKFSSLPPGNYVKFSIKDDGIGIPEEDMGKVFDPFFTTKQDGSGLGLASSYSIVKKHGGLIAVESEPGKGSVFTVFLPALSATEEEPSITGSRQETADGPRGKILFMDDEKIIRESNGLILREIGYSVETAGGGEEALKLYREAMNSGDTFDAVILDLTIPDGMGGLETMEKLLQIDPAVKAVVTSGFSNDPAINNYKALGFKEKISKPYSIKNLDGILRKITSRDTEQTNG